MNIVKGLLARYEEQWRYILVGCGTTAVNYAVYFLLNLLGVYYIASNVAAWVCAVTFAYFAIGGWVFKSTANRGLREAGAFALSRLFSLGLETALLFLLVDIAGLDQTFTKLFLLVLVVVVNYITGRIVYHAGKEKET